MSRRNTRGGNFNEDAQLQLMIQASLTSSVKALLQATPSLSAEQVFETSGVDPEHRPFVTELARKETVKVIRKTVASFMRAKEGVEGVTRRQVFERAGVHEEYKQQVYTGVFWFFLFLSCLELLVDKVKY